GVLRKARGCEQLPLPLRARPRAAAAGGRLPPFERRAEAPRRRRGSVLLGGGGRAAARRRAASAGGALMARVRRVAALPGEGIGPEVVDAALQVLRRAAEICGSRLEIERAPFGKDAYRELGSYFPETTAEVCRRSDGILLGAVERGGLLELRKHFDFF